MSLLLDTHVWLWLMLQSSRLRSDVREALQDGSNALSLSPISIWEALLLAERGRLGAVGDPASWLRRALIALPLLDAPLTREVALVSRALELPHQDPADRFIGATARVHRLTLVTADKHLLESAEVPTLSAR